MVSAIALCLVAPVAVAGPEEDTQQAESEFARGNLIVAMSLWRKAADLGYAPAQARLGDMYDKTEEDKEAVEWYRKAAAQGDASGEFGLGHMYAKGEGIAKDIEQAQTYVSRAAEKGHLQAMVLMREAYRVGGLGLGINLSKSAEWNAKVQQAIAQAKPAAANSPASGNSSATAPKN